MDPPVDPHSGSREGGLANVVDNYQATNNGIIPIVVAIDATGDVAANPVCTDSPKDKVMTYLTQEVTDSIIHRFSPNPDQKTWTIGGFSYGGTRPPGGHQLLYQLRKFPGLLRRAAPQ